MKVEIWSDMMCPFCYIGKRHWEKALAQFSGKDAIEVEWKSFQLNPALPEDAPVKQNAYEYLAQHKGMSYEASVQMHERVTQMAKQAGLDYHFDKTQIVNSFKAHRLIQLAKLKGLSDAAEERLFLAYFTEGKDLGDAQVLSALGKEIGLDEQDVAKALNDEVFATAVDHDLSEARQLGVSGVPFFVFDRKYAVSGAQPPESFLQVLEKSFKEWKKEHPESVIHVSQGPSCGPDEDCK